MFVRRDWRIEKKALLFPLEVCQIHPQMPFRYHHGCHGPAHSSGSLLGGTEDHMVRFFIICHIHNHTSIISSEMQVELKKNTAFT